MSLENEAISVHVGLRLRELRESRRISMRELARRSELSANALSMIERNLTSPSVSTLIKLANALEVPITAFFRYEPEKQQVVFRKSDERLRVPFMRGLWEGLGGESFTGKMEAFLLTLENGGSSGPYGMLHSGHEFVYCLQGKIEYVIDGKVHLLETGDILIFEATLPHLWRNPFDVEAKFILVLQTPNASREPVQRHFSSHPSVNHIGG
jgi:transcriptional regulator with XRE-family HTH domain